ncbi:DUF4118 domain-containing protein [Sphingomonas sp. ST-64]|uniref:histidine kinase n=1 Tax=Sphingomonas plantiphila TaxID=3163295 RepID=A0ABW8YS29_9SPHN
MALLLAGFAWWARWALDPAFPQGFPYLTFFPAVILTAFLFGRGPGIFSAVLCGVLAWYSFVPPVHSFSVTRGTSITLAFYLGVVTVDILLIDWMQRGNEQLMRERERSEQLVAHSQLLFSELQHRVSNNLQMVGAVLSLQRRGVTDPTARQALSEAAAKLQTIGRIQRQLYDTSGAPLAPDRLLPDLTRDLIETAGRPGIDWEVDVPPGIELPTGSAIPLALVLAESVANAIEHGFAGREEGQILVAMAQQGSMLILSVSDDGAGPPEGFDATTSNSLGLRIARTLAEQLSGDFSLTAGPDGGAMATLRIPVQSATA